MKRSAFIIGILGLALLGLTFYVSPPKKEESSASRTIASDNKESESASKETYRQKICHQEKRIQNLEGKIEELLDNQKSVLQALRTQGEISPRPNPLLRMPHANLMNRSVNVVDTQPIHYGPSREDIYNQYDMQKNLSRDFSDIPLYETPQRSQKPVVQNFYYGNSQQTERPSMPGFQYERKIVPTYRRDPANNSGLERGDFSSPQLFRDSFQFSQNPEVTQ